MSKVTSFEVTYDAGSDVLYISKKKVPASRGVEDQYGFVWRYDADGNLIGLTVVDFQEFWTGKRSLLTQEMAEHFAISQAQADVVLDHVTG
jgi:uncharacterized protein YuzE